MAVYYFRIMMMAVLFCYLGLLNIVGGMQATSLKKKVGSENCEVVFYCPGNRLSALDLMQYKDADCIIVRCNLIAIDRHAFDGLNHLRKLDFSDNDLAYLHPETFAGLPNFSILILNDNVRLRSVKGQPFLQSNSIKQLQVLRTNVGSVNSSGMPNLEVIYCDDNSCLNFPRNSADKTSAFLRITTDRTPLLAALDKSNGSEETVTEISGVLPTIPTTVNGMPAMKLECLLMSIPILLLIR